MLHPPLYIVHFNGTRNYGEAQAANPKQYR
jgi:hypothetical protein